MGAKEDTKEAEVPKTKPDVELKEIKVKATSDMQDVSLEPAALKKAVPKKSIFSCFCGGGPVLDDEAEVATTLINGTKIMKDGHIEHEVKADDEFLDAGEEEEDKNVDTWAEAEEEGVEMEDVEVLWTEELGETLPADAVVRQNAKGQKVVVMRQTKMEGSKRQCRRYRPLVPRLNPMAIHSGAWKLYLKNLPLALVFFWLFVTLFFFIHLFALLFLMYFLCAYHNAYMYTAQSGKMAPMAVWLVPFKGGGHLRMVMGSIMIATLMFSYFILPGVLIGIVVEKFLYPVHDLLWTQLFFFKRTPAIKAYVASARLIRKSRIMMGQFFLTAPFSCCMSLGVATAAPLVIIGTVLFAIPLGLFIGSTVILFGYMVFLVANYVSYIKMLIWGPVFFPVLIAVIDYIYIERVHRGEGRPDYPVLSGDMKELWDNIPETPPYMIAKKGTRDTHAPAGQV